MGAVMSGPKQKEVQPEVPTEVQVKPETVEEQPHIELLMKKLENESMEKLEALKNAENNNTTNIPLDKALENIMQSGADEFEKQTGRKMTYGEMREMYG
jgi:hypothetical protein